MLLFSSFTLANANKQLSNNMEIFKRELEENKEMAKQASDRVNSAQGRVNDPQLRQEIEDCRMLINSLVVKMKERTQERDAQNLELVEVRARNEVLEDQSREMMEELKKLTSSYRDVISQVSLVTPTLHRLLFYCCFLLCF